MAITESLFLWFLAFTRLWVWGGVYLKHILFTEFRINIPCSVLVHKVSADT